jgi:hypothetical protein
MLAGGGAANASRIKSLALAGSTDAWTSKLDLANNDMAIDYTGDSPRNTIQNQIKSGFANGSWNGNGITSSSAQASTSPKGAIGFAEASTLGVGTFDGAAVDSTTLLIKYTLGGDANLNGIVNALDFNALASSFGASSMSWINGDFNYDGTVNSLDFPLLAANFNQVLLSAPALGSQVPEPSLLGLIAVGLALGRRRTLP